MIAAVWNTNKVIDFVNWYIDLKGLGENNKLENPTIVESFLNGDSVDVWKNIKLPEGFKVYTCTDCQEINVLKDNGQITVGFCTECKHPLWNE